MRGWLCPRIWVRSLTFSSLPASSARIRSRVASPAARSPLKAWARDRFPEWGWAWSTPDIKICLCVLGRLGKVEFPLAIDQDFGAATELAVMRFQGDKKLTVDGIVGQETWDAIEKAAKA
jgi:peptidoglycan hydrolase-like protein with peptidoglycan-binding domain